MTPTQSDRQLLEEVNTRVIRIETRMEERCADHERRLTQLETIPSKKCRESDKEKPRDDDKRWMQKLIASMVGGLLVLLAAVAAVIKAMGTGQ